MKGKRYLLIGLLFGIVIGWALGFLRFPYIEKNFSFLLGFMAALAFVSLALILLTAWNKAFLPGLVGKKTITQNSKNTRTHTFIWIILGGVLVLGGVTSGFAIFRQIESFRHQIQNQDKQLHEMAALLDFVKKQDMGPLMRSVLDDVDKEIKGNPGRMLRDTTIARIAALSFASRPYKYIEDDSLSEKAYSPERGQLLKALLLMQPDTGSFARIKQKTLFAGADLRGADLKGLDLSGINLMEANLKDVDLSGADLSGANLGEANFWGANLNRANLSHADLKRADMSWAQLNQATFTQANLDGANLTNAQLTNADLQDATFQWAQSGGALFNGANLRGVDLFGTDLTKANMRQANLDDANLRYVNLGEADLIEAQLNKAVVDQNWPEKIKKWQPQGVKLLQEGYRVVNDTFDQWKVPMYRLQKTQ